MADDNEFTPEVSGKFRYNIDYISDYPPVANFVKIDKLSDNERHVIMYHVFRLKTTII